MIGNHENKKKENKVRRTMRISMGASKYSFVKKKDKNNF